jgi:hypothetical protein
MRRFLGIVMGVALLAASAASWADEYTDTVALFKNAQESKDFFKNCYGYAVFPTIGKGGLGVGAAHGNGRVYEKGKYIGDTSMTQVSIGLRRVVRRTVSWSCSRTSAPWTNSRAATLRLART